jgi:hypothetical protein
MKNKVIKPIATALWLIKNTKLTFNQIAQFCNISEAEIESMADGFEKSFLEPNNPIKVGQLTEQEVKKCEDDPKMFLKLSPLPIFPDTSIKVSKKSYTSLSDRKNKINGALFLIERHKILPIEVIARLTKATKGAVQKLLEGTYPKMEELTPRDPISLGLCTQVKLNEELAKFTKVGEK